MNFVFSMFFFAVWPGGRRCANCRDAHFFERYCDESIFTWKTCKTTMEKTKKNKKKQSSDPWARSGERPGRGHGFERFVFFGFSMFFLQFGQDLEKTKKTKKNQTHGQGLGYPHTNQKKQKTKKHKKPRNQKTKKQKNKKKQKKKIAHPRGGVRCRVLGLVFFFLFLFFCFFGLCVDSHCRCAKQRSGTVSGCTRSKVDTLQYSNVCYDIVHSANEQQRGMEFNFVRLRHMLLDLCTGNAAICALPWWPVLLINLQQWWCFMGYWDVTDDATWCNHQNPIESH